MPGRADLVAQELADRDGLDRVVGVPFQLQRPRQLAAGRRQVIARDVRQRAPGVASPGQFLEHQRATTGQDDRIEGLLHQVDRNAAGASSMARRCTAGSVVWPAGSRLATTSREPVFFSVTYSVVRTASV